MYLHMYVGQPFHLIQFDLLHTAAKKLEISVIKDFLVESICIAVNEFLNKNTSVVVEGRRQIKTVKFAISLPDNMFDGSLFCILACAWKVAV